MYEGLRRMYIRSVFVANMADALVPGKKSKRGWALSETALHQLLQWLDEGEDSKGGKYLEMRRRMVSYFERKGCSTLDELADETLNRVARRLQEEGSLTATVPARYCYIVARFVLLEHLREPTRNPLNFEDLSNRSQSSVVEQNDRHEKRLDCLERCLKGVDPEDRTVIFQYYQGAQRIKIENRRAVAAALGLTSNALSIRACRIRSKLETCVKACLSGVKEF